MIILNKKHREICSREVTREIPNSETISAINEVPVSYTHLTLPTN